ncbi:hypothetical protein DUI87_10976 [Hirundo rustica rustica]|uniref:Uncharacterized protein n=1 Tax=Hirundo rustica rustica TaxID=333673 RepID=A0A3M0KJK4_HIRRU|nr:hypothetical protein DUI87_10976 [Hirundo rustica rustica]
MAVEMGSGSLQLGMSHGCGSLTLAKRQSLMKAVCSPSSAIVGQRRGEKFNEGLMNCDKDWEKNTAFLLPLCGNFKTSMTTRHHSSFCACFYGYVVDIPIKKNKEIMVPEKAQLSFKILIFSLVLTFFGSCMQLSMMKKIGIVNALNSTLENSASLQLVMKIHVETVLHVFQSPGEMLFACVHMEGLASSAVMFPKYNSDESMITAATRQIKGIHKSWRLGGKAIHLNDPLSGSLTPDTTVFQTSGVFYYHLEPSAGTAPPCSSSIFSSLDFPEYPVRKVGLRGKVTLQAMIETVVRQLAPSSPWSPTMEQISTCRPWRIPGCDPTGNLCHSRVWQDLWTQEEKSPHEQFDGRICDLWETHAVKNCSPWKGLMLEKFMEDCLPWEGIHTGMGKEYEWVFH